MIRKATNVDSVHLKIKQPSENDLQMEQTATAASIPGTTEKYILDWQWRNSHDTFFGDPDAGADGSVNKRPKTTGHKWTERRRTATGS
jgi:hypothetical protein